MKRIEFVEFELENGLRGVVYENHSAPIVTVDVWYHVGSKNEDPNRTGLAHLFEHLMFQGSKHVGKAEHFKHVQEAGGTLNGSTNFDRTNYYETLPANQLDLALWLEADRMMSLNLNEENFENQRQVVMEERRQRYDNAPYGRAYEELHKRAYVRHPYRWIPIGSMEHLQAATLEDARRFYETFYAPNNATLVVSGDVNPDEAREKIERYFGDIPRNGAIPRPKNEDEPLAEEIRDALYDNAQLPALFIAYRICNATSPDADALSLVSAMLSDGRSSRLYRALVHDNRLAQTVSTRAAANEHDGLFYISLIAHPETDLAELEKRLDDELQKVVEGDIGESELEKAKNAAEMELVRTLSSNFGMADTLAYFQAFFGSASHINDELARIEAVSLDDAKRVARKYLGEKKRVVLRWLPRSARPTIVA
ncbi:MAG: insulinase family protein [Chloroherpetonaceae bacterium]|nr:insulinase family protein [Chloroherpetonaceae bacterium]MDW8438276.1 pitrilysin family protein [Chloroherpetonaceae bacterium]